MVITRVPEIWGSKRTEFEGETRGHGLFTAINPRQTVVCAIWLVLIVSCHGNTFKNSPWQPVCLMVSYCKTKVRVKLVLTILFRKSESHPPNNEQFEFTTDEVLDLLFHRLHSEGLGTTVKSADIFTQEDEQKLWSSGILSLSTPKSLQNAFYTVGKMFCLRGGVEHRALKLSQLKWMTDPDRYIWVWSCLQNHNGSFMQLHAKNKVVPVFARISQQRSVDVNNRTVLQSEVEGIQSLQGYQGLVWLVSN